MGETYLHNSKHKETIRDKWIEFSTEITQGESLSMITFPAEEMHDLHLFAERGLIRWQKTETGAYKISNETRLICFEKSSKICTQIQKKLVGAIVLQTEIGAFLREKYQAIMNKTSKVFPVDIVNLDYDGNLSKHSVPISETIELIFKCQALHKKDFALFITWPQTEAEDENEYKKLLKRIIEENLDNPQAVKFKEEFERSHKSVNQLDYEKLSIIGLTKIIVHHSSSSQYGLIKNEFYLYGEANRRRMFSVLMNFKFHSNTAKHALYTSDVPKTLDATIDLSRKVA